MSLARRKAIHSGLLGGNRRWLWWGGAAWVFHWIGRLFGGGKPEPRYTRRLEPGERVIVVHEPVGAITAKKQAKAERKARKKADRRVARADARAPSDR